MSEANGKKVKMGFAIKVTDEVAANKVYAIAAEQNCTVNAAGEAIFQMGLKALEAKRGGPIGPAARRSSLKQKIEL